MNEKRTDFVTLLCWLALGFGGVILVIFVCSMIFDFFSKDNPKKEVTHVSVEVNDPNSNTQQQEDETIYNTGKEDKIATVTTHSNYMNGYNDGTFGPYGGISRAEVAAIFARLDKKFNENKVYYNGRFSDVSDEAWYSNYIGYCANELIMQGYSDGSFGPGVKMNKREFYVAIVRYAEVNYNGCTSKYADVKGTWAEPYIGYLEKMGYISGKDANNLGATDNITRAEVCSVINYVLDRKPDKAKVDATQKKAFFSDVPKTAWFYYDVVEATTFHDISLYHKEENNK